MTALPAAGGGGGRGAATADGVLPPIVQISEGKVGATQQRPSNAAASGARGSLVVAFTPRNGNPGSYGPVACLLREQQIRRPRLGTPWTPTWLATRRPSTDRLQMSLVIKSRYVHL